MENVVERYKLLNDVTMEIVSTHNGYDVIYRQEKRTYYFLKNAELTAAYTFVAGFLYNRYWNEVNNFMLNRN